MRRRGPGRRPDHSPGELKPLSSRLTESALLIPVPEADELVGPWRSRYNLAAQKGVPPHITILSPFLQPDEINERIVGDLRELFATIEPFSFALARVGRFPLALYLAPEPAESFVRLTKAVWERYPDHPPYGGVFADIIPHLSVANCETEGLCEDPDSVLDEVERAIVGGVPIEARAREVWLMVGNGRWSLRARSPLGG